MIQTLRYSRLVLFIAAICGFSGAPATTQPKVDKITIYPNPATEFISIDNAKNVKEIRILNLVGRKLLLIEHVEQNTPYYIRELPNGMYLVQIVDNANKIMTTQRLSKR